jgi:hypothetical protein
LLTQLGHPGRAGFTNAADYTAELWDSQIGFEWRGSGYLTHRLIEYIRAGVVPITRPLGKEWPIREDVVLEDGVHCVFCSDPYRFAQEASRLLLDQQKIGRIRGKSFDVVGRETLPASTGVLALVEDKTFDRITGLTKIYRIILFILLNHVNPV